MVEGALLFSEALFLLSFAYLKNSLVSKLLTGDGGQFMG